jgi:hypothetical protein
VLPPVDLFPWPCWWVRLGPPSDAQHGDVHSKVLLLRRSSARCSGGDDLVPRGESSGEVWSGGGPPSLLCWWSASTVTARMWVVVIFGLRVRVFKVGGGLGLVLMQLPRQACLAQ